MNERNERSRISPGGMYGGKVYSEVTQSENKYNFSGRRDLLAVCPHRFSSSFGIAGPVMMGLNEVAVGREGSTLTW